MKKIYFLFLLATILLISSFTTCPLGDGTDNQVKILQLYPNPATAYIYFEIPNNTEKVYTLHIYNFIGKKVNEFQISNTKITVSLDSYYRGLYVYQLRDSKGNIVESGKFQVMK